MGLWSFVLPTATTNLITNPSLESGDTGYTAAGSASLARTALEQAFGLYSLKITPTSAGTDGAYYALTLSTSTQYTFSFSIKGVDGVAYTAYFYDVTAASQLGTAVTFPGDGTWRRYSVTATTNANTSIRVYVTKNADADTGDFYTDGWQVEALGYATTYCDGDQDGCTWSAGSHSSSSSRSAQSAEGGRVIDLDSSGYDFRVRSTIGVGMAPVELKESPPPAQTDGVDHQRTVVGPRDFSLVGDFAEGDRGTYHTGRLNLIKALAPDRLPTDQPVQIRYTYSSKSVAIKARYAGGLEKNSQPGPTVESVPLRFRAQPDPYFIAVPGTTGGAFGQGNGATSATVRTTVTNANRIIEQTSAGVWQAMETGLSRSDTGGLAGDCLALGVGLDGRIYIGGDFTSATEPLPGGATVSNSRAVVYWDGRQFRAMGTGADDGEVYAIAVHPTTGDVYVGGSFTGMGGVANTAYIAYWDISAGDWNSLQTGASDTVRALEFDSNANLYVGGDFADLDGVSNTSGIGYWDGAAFNAMGTGATIGLTGVRDIAVDASDNVCIVGNFSDAGGVANTNGHAKWNGSAWSSISTELLSTGDWVQSVAVDLNGNIYVGSAREIASTGHLLAKWNGASWAAVSGTEYESFTSRHVVALTNDNDSGKIYTASLYDVTSPPGSYAYEIAADGTVTEVIDENDDIQAVTIGPDKQVYLGGAIDVPFSDDQPASDNSIVRYNGAGIVPINYFTRAILQATDGKIWVVGGFTGAGASGGAGVSYWNGTAFVDVGDCDGVIYAIAESPGGDIYVAGDFTDINSVSAAGLAYYDGTSWNAVGSGLDAGAIYALAFSPSGTLYIGGLFTGLGGVASTKNLGTWDGSNFASIGEADGAVYALVFDSAGQLYLGGNFGDLGGTSAANVGKYASSAFSALSTGTNGPVFALGVQSDGGLVLGGAFTTAGSETVNYLARWNGSGYSAFGAGLNNYVYTLRVDPNTDWVYLGGAFTVAGTLDLPDKAAVWAGGNYTALPVDLPGDAAVRAIMVSAAGQIVLGFDTLGSATAAGSTTATNGGSSKTYPIFTIQGPGQLFQIANYTTGHFIYYDVTLQSGEVATLDLRPGEKTFISSFRGDLLDKIEPGSDLESFFMVPGDNTISIFIDDSATAYATWQERHWSFDGAVA